MKNFWKIGLIFILFVAVSVSSVLVASYYKYLKSPEYVAEQYVVALEKRYMEDDYGGNTPEETLQMFIDALKVGDIDLASKYFVVEKQEEWRENLNKIKDGDQLDNMISDLERTERGNDISENLARFVVANDQDEVITVMGIVKIINGKWKIDDM